MSDPMHHFQYLTLTKTDFSATIALNRPEVGNAFAPQSYGEIEEAFALCGQDDGIRVVILTGNGKHFSAGGDIAAFRKYIESGTFIRRENVLRAGRMADAVRLCPKPVVAMVNGAAAGAGCALALACDFRVMAPESKLIASFSNIGLSGDTGCMYFLERMLGMSKTTEVMMLGSAITGEEAYRLGLANRLSATGELEQTTLQLANQLAARPTQAIARQKRLSYEFFYRDLAQFHEREADYMCETSHTEDFKETVYAFLEKRRPEFTGQ